MTLHPLAEQFGAVADVYERGRPEYTPAVIAALEKELALAPDARVLDLAAGTGKLARAMLAAGMHVVAVEPQASLRELLAQRIGAERVHDGFAEAIPLADASVDAVTVADAFHWFDQGAALSEIRRVLRPAGGLAVLVTVPDWRGASWAPEVGELMQHERPRHPHFDGPPWQDALAAAGGWSAPRETRVTATHAADVDGVLDYLASVSWIAAMPAERRAETLTRLRAIVSAGETPAELPVHFIIGCSSLR